MQVASSLSFQLCQQIEGFTGAFPSSDMFFGGDAEVASRVSVAWRPAALAPGCGGVGAAL